MVRLDVFWDAGDISRFTLTGHAGYAQAGQDIVCAGVSVLVYNAINSCETFAGIELHVVDEEELACKIPINSGNTTADRDVQLFLKSMVFGVRQLECQYRKHVVVIDHGISNIL